MEQEVISCATAMSQDIAGVDIEIVRSRWRYWGVNLGLLPLPEKGVDSDECLSLLLTVRCAKVLPAFFSLTLATISLFCMFFYIYFLFSCTLTVKW